MGYKDPANTILYNKNYYENNKEAYITRALSWRSNNLERSREIHKNSQRRRRASDLVNLSERIKLSIRRAFRSVKINKSGQTFKMLPYTKEELREHLYKFLDKPCVICKEIILTIKNSHIDHIKPISLASTAIEIIEFSKLDNLRLLCRICNIKKSDKL